MSVLIMHLELKGKAVNANFELKNNKPRVHLISAQKWIIRERPSKASCVDRSNLVSMRAPTNRYNCYAVEQPANHSTSHDGKLIMVVYYSFVERCRHIHGVEGILQRTEVVFFRLLVYATKSSPFALLVLSILQ